MSQTSALNQKPDNHAPGEGPRQHDFDLFVIGAGSGGVRAARLAAQRGKKVGVAEGDLPGGTCVVRGCVPKKFLVYGADYGESLKEAREYGWQVGEARFDWAHLRDHVQSEVSRLSGIYTSLMDKNGVSVFREWAEFVDAHTLRLSPSGETVTAETILIAVGGHPWKPPIPGAEHAIVSDDAFTLAKLPERMLVIGGGYIACEFAGIFQGLGVEVTQAHRGGRLLKGFDAEIRDEAAKIQTLNGIDLRLNAEPTEIKKLNSGYKVTFSNGMQIGTDLVFMGTGRRPNTSRLGCAAAGVELGDKGEVLVDEFSQTSAPNIYAVGDVTRRMELTPVAIREAAAVIETLYEDNPTAYDHTNIATAVFTRPPIGVVGLTEGEARQKYGEDVTVYTTQFRPMKNVLGHDPQRCFYKLVTQGEDNRVVGVHLAGDHSGEIIQMAGIAVKAGLSKDAWDATCAVHPTIAEELVTLKPREMNKMTVVS